MSRGYSDAKVYIGELGNNAVQTEIEDAFSYYGPLKSVWIARSPPGFAFVEYEDPRDARDAIRGMDGRSLCGRRVIVEMSNGKRRSRGGGFGGFRGGGGGGGGYRGDSYGSSGNCFECGKPGHFAASCPDRRGGRGGGGGGGGRRRSRSPRGRDSRRSRSRSRSSSNGRDRISRSRSPKGSR